MTRDSFSGKSKFFLGKDLYLPNLPNQLESIMSEGKSMPIDGTNVVRVPFGVRQARRERPERPKNWATLVLPLQSSGGPTPPPQAA